MTHLFMKKKLSFLVVLFFLTLTSQNSCTKEPTCVCGVENPESNLQWLKIALETIFNANIYQIVFENKEYIIIADFPGPDAISVVYDCDGTKMCEYGGINPGGNICTLNNPAAFWTFFEGNKKLIFKCRFNPE